jgi:hypothetical protein
MGSWGPGVLENDHAQGLLSIETDRWATELNEALDRKDALWDDIEGPLVYVQLLAFAGRESGDLSIVDRKKPISSRDIATAWKARYIELYAEGIEVEARRKVIEEQFDALIAVARTNDAPPKKEFRRRKLR